jgi:outer membrane protein assembly factor BamD
VLLAGASCGKFRKLEKSTDWRIKYEGALDYYSKKKYYKASALFDQILPIIRGLPEGEKVQFLNAYCQYNMKFYLLASEQFKTFYETFGRSPQVEEARYMYSYSLYKSSPRSSLDQTNSIDAMASMQEFLNRYPNSKYKEQAIQVIYATQEKLEKKGFDNANLYFKMKSYKAAVVSLKNFLNNFPDSKYVEQTHYLILLSEYKQAEKSIRSKQLDRYKELVEDYKTFLEKFPQSSYLQDAEKLYADSIDKINKLKTNKNINS